MNPRAPALSLILLSYPLINAGLTSLTTTDPRWLMLPDLAFGTGVLAGLSKDRLFVPLSLTFTGLIALALGYPALAGLIPAMLYLLVARHFDRSLHGPQAAPLITRIAALAHGPDRPLSDAVKTYTRRLTKLWSVFLLFLSATSAATTLWLPETGAFLFSNTLAPLLLLLFLILEFPVRQRVLPKEERTPLPELLRLLLKHGWSEPQARLEE